MAEKLEIIDDDDRDERDEMNPMDHWAIPIASFGLIAATMAVGYCIGESVHVRENWIVSSICLWSVIISLVALFRGFVPRYQCEAKVGLLLLVFVAFSMFMSFPWWFGSVVGVLINIAWLVPLFVGLLVLPRRRFWITSMACWQLLLAASIACGHNMTHWWSGIGFFFAWIS
ncbi:hypothetical protein BH11PLA2_BH11PLA2_13420 [soil metagenome]